ncbi:prepilin-type N-terminal cleavage/methylation domain-containing protein [Undibacterium sp. GrIS 1.2]|uniref:pilus assembly FimT family protein n=1 Tax=Undibacterium sp. GrIS 1.2 TaxID=3143933 RepID=UPI00339A029D
MTILSLRHQVGPDCQHLVAKREIARGFTLIEMMAVLTLTAIMAGVAVPAMQRWFDSVSERAQLTEISIQFQRLASRAALLSETVKLSKVNWMSKLGDGTAALSLPDGWSIANGKPVVFFHSGICEGGIIELIDPQARKVKLNIEPVSCDVSIIRS